MKICENIDLNSRPHVRFPAQLDEFIEHLKNSLDYFVGINAQHADLFRNFNSTDHVLFRIIHKCINKVALDSQEKELIINLSRAFRYDTEHDFGSGAAGTRDNCKTELVQQCVRSVFRDTGDILGLESFVHEKLERSNVQDCCIPNSNIIHDKCKKDLTDINYIIKDTSVKGLAKVAIEMTGGKDIYRGISSSIDPAGCRKQKVGEYSVANSINFKKELFIYNIGLIFYQSFFNVFVNKKLCMWIAIDEVREAFENNKKFNVHIVNYQNKDEDHVVINNVIGGGNSLFSPQKICYFLNSKIGVLQRVYSGIPNDYEICRGFQLIMKGYGDFGQLFWTIFLYFTRNFDHSPDFYHEKGRASLIPFYNNCMLTTIDTFLAAIGSLLNAPLILGTDVKYHKYIVDINKKYYGENILSSYNRYNKLQYLLEPHIINIQLLPIQDIEKLVLGIENFDIGIMADEYNAFYNEYIKYFIIKFNTESYRLYEITIDHGNNRNLRMLFDDTTFWKFPETNIYITENMKYPGQGEQVPANHPTFINYRDTITNRNYYDLVNAKIYYNYVNIFFNYKLDRRNPIFTNAYYDLTILQMMQARQRGNNKEGSLIRKTMAYVFFIKKNNYESWWRRASAGTTNIPNAIKNTEKQFIQINSILTNMIQTSELIHNKINTMYNNIKVLEKHYNLNKTRGNPITEELEILTNNYRILIQNENIKNWFDFIENKVCNYLKLEITKVFYYDYKNMEIDMDDMEKQDFEWSDYFKNIYDIYTNNLDIDIVKNSVPSSSIKGVELCIDFLKEFILNISKLSKYYNLINLERQRINNLPLLNTITPDQVDQHYFLVPDNPHEKNSIDNILIKIENDDNELNNQDCSNLCNSDKCTNPDQVDTKYMDDLRTGILHEYEFYRKLLMIGGETQYTAMQNNRPQYIMSCLIEVYVLILNNIYRYLVKLDNNKNKINSINIEKNIIEKDVSIKVCEVLIEIFVEITKNTKNALIRGDDFNANKELLFNTFNLNDDELVQIRKIKDHNQYKLFFNMMLLNKVEKETANFVCENSLRDLIRGAKKLYYFSSCEATRQGRVHLGGNISINIEIYLKRIENIKKKIKLLKKNKIQNKNKIIQQNDFIKGLKLKMKSEKEKEKVRKQKEKLRKQNEKDAEKKKLKKDKEKLKKQKENESEKKSENESEKKKLKKDKEKLKKQKENEKEKLRKEKEKKQKEKENESEKEKLRKEKEKKQKENEKEKQRKQKDKEKVKLRK